MKEHKTGHSHHHEHGKHASGHQVPHSERHNEHRAHQKGHDGHDKHAGHAGGHGGHGGHGAHADHTGHEEMFRQRFWVSLVLTIPVLLYSPMLQEWFGFSMPTFLGSEWIGALFSVIIFVYGGLPFLQMAVPELENRKPGMMTLISLAITVAAARKRVDLSIVCWRSSYRARKASAARKRVDLGAGDAD